MSSKQVTPPLESRIATSLNAADITSDALADLIAEAEVAAQAADAEAARTREQALDPGIVVDVTKIAATVTAAELVRDRLQAALPRLRKRYTEARSAEDDAKWNAEAAELRTRREEMVTEFAQMLPVELIKGIVEKLVAMREFDWKINAHNLRLYEMQLRGGGDGCRSVPNATPAFAQELRIPDMERPPGHFLWPSPHDPAPVLNMIPVDRFVGQFAADGTYARRDDERRRAAEEHELEEARQRERVFEAMQGGT